MIIQYLIVGYRAFKDVMEQIGLQRAMVTNVVVSVDSVAVGFAFLHLRAIH